MEGTDDRGGICVGIASIAELGAVGGPRGGSQRKRIGCDLGGLAAVITDGVNTAGGNTGWLTAKRDQLAVGTNGGETGIILAGDERQPGPTPKLWAPKNST